MIEIMKYKLSMSRGGHTSSKPLINDANCRRDDVVFGASASQLVDLGFIPLVKSY